MNSSKTIRIVLLVIVIGVIGLLVYNKISKDKKTKATGREAAAGSRTLLVDAYVVSPVKLQNSIDAAGTLLSNESVDLQPEISGRVTHIYFREGTHVRKGDLLVKLFDEDLQAQLEKSKVQQQLNNLTLQRQEKLLAINGISQQEVDNTRNQIATVQADVDNIQAQIRKTEIVAPFDGIIGLRNASEGAILSPTTIIAHLEQTDPLKTEFSIPEKYLDQVRLGDKITFTVAAYPGKTFTGKIYAMDPAIDPTTRTIKFRALSTNPGGMLTPGSFANVHIDLKEIPDAIMIPAQSLIPTTRDNQVIVIHNGKAKFVNVQTGIQTKDDVQITSGLQAGDTVVTAGLIQAKPGLPLKILHLAKHTDK